MVNGSDIVKKNFIKIIYFDELSATDFLIIKDNGYKDILMESSDESINNKKGDIKAKIAGGSFLGFIMSRLQLEGEFSFERNKDEIVKTTVTNALLTDFINHAQKSEIKLIEGVTLKPYNNSITFIKLFSPYLQMISTNGINKDDMPLNFSLIDDAIEKGKGYYEMIAENKDNKKFVLRFNINAFRNNYKLSDLIKMDLSYYAIKVGTTTEAELMAEYEMSLEKDVNLLEEYNKNVDETTRNDKFDVYDVFLAGVTVNDC